ncbi:MAG: aminotransferase class I/II-fold pyridoxal phosphate-dependent enzyme [Pirellulales bacterium]|nr:aminotransferase class I/II-fold pyridoxal phosphate-dependent enzyme [Pirellulales bacterium]
MDVHDPLLSEYGGLSAQPSPVARMMAAFAADFRDDIDINLGVGYVNESTIPRASIERSLREVLADPRRYRAALNYGGPAGSRNLIESIRRFHLEHGIGGLTEDVFARNRMIIGPNGATSLLEGVAHVLRPGIVITTDPIYYIYCNFLERLGYEVCAVAEDQHGMDADRLEARLVELGDRRRDVRFLYIVTVNNPTCTVLSTCRRQRLVEIASRLSRESKRKIPLLFDKAYENLIHDPEVEKPRSGLLFDELGIVYEIGTLSKILAPALRIGYLIGPPGPLVAAMVQKTSDAGFSAPLVTQEMASYLLDHCVPQQIRAVNAGYREKAAATRQWIDASLGRFLSDCRGGSAGFYYYLSFAHVETHENSAFFRFLSRTTGDPKIDGRAVDRNPRVVYIPGQFCVHPRGELVDAGRRQLRLSYGFEELPRIRQAMELLRDAATYAEATC